MKRLELRSHVQGRRVTYVYYDTPTCQWFRVTTDHTSRLRWREAIHYEPIMPSWYV